LPTRSLDLPDISLYNIKTPEAVVAVVVPENGLAAKESQVLLAT
jgi:hypothetical protein